jgi:putative membrane protein
MWEADRGALIAIALMALLYAGGAIALRRRPRRRQMLAYTLGLMVVFGAITGPVDHYSKERSFFVYITQQMLLIFVAPPLLLLGIPDWMARPVMLNRLVEPVARIITKPVFTFLFFSGVFALVHYPALCDRVCHVRPYFGDIRELVFVSGILLWWPLTSPLPEYPRMSYPMQILYLFLLMIPTTAVAAPVTLAGSVLYMFYMEGPHPFGLTPMADQVLGGIIMWVGQGVYIMFAFSAIFFRWARREDSEIPPINRQAVPQLQVVRGL